MDYSNYIKEHPNSLIITNTEEEFIDVGVKLGWTKEDCIQRWKVYKDDIDDLAIICINGSYLNYCGRNHYLHKYESEYKSFKRISYSEFLGTTDDYQIY